MPPPPLFYGPYPLSLRSRVQGDREVPDQVGDDKMVAGMTSRSNCSIMKRGVLGPFQGFFLFQNETKWPFFASY